MMKIEFDGVKINVPNSWNDITLAQYEKVFLLEPKTPLETIQYIADVCNIEAKIFLDAPYVLFEKVSDAVSFLTEWNFEPENKITINNENYFISDSNDLTLAEWVDVESVFESESQTKISEILAILCRPMGEKYNTKVAEQRRCVFRNLKCNEVLPLISFFLLKKKKSEKILSHCLTVITQANQFLKGIKIFALNGDGIKRFPTWQMIKYYYLMRSLKKQLLKFSDSYYIKQIRQKQKMNNTILRNK